jgi:glycosyltransferase involved in cell wall biosynthesis
VPIAKLCGVRKYVRVRNNLGYWLTRRHRILEQMLRPLVDVTLTNSNSGKDALVASGIQSHRVVVLENGVDHTSGDQPRAVSYSVGCVANLREVKNIDGLMRAASIVRKQQPDAT